MVLGRGTKLPAWRRHECYEVLCTPVSTPFEGSIYAKRPHVGAGAAAWCSLTVDGNSLCNPILRTLRRNDQPQGTVVYEIIVRRFDITQAQDVITTEQRMRSAASFMLDVLLQFARLLIL
jgi:hypothetical protein